MDFQKLADSFFSPTCIVSVEKTDACGYGAIRLVTANRKYLDIIEMRLKSDRYQVAADTSAGFVPNSLYTDYFPQNRSFEDVCFRAAVGKTDVHTYAHLSNVDMWFDIYGIPLNLDEGNLCYCIYSASPSKNADMVLSTLNTARTSNDVLKTCIKLHRADNLKDAMENVISEVRQICKAECCTVLLMNDEEKKFSILATDFRENSKIRRVTTFSGYYDIAKSWKDMIGEEGDCIIIQDQKDMDEIRRTNNPWYQTLVQAGVVSVVLFPLRQGTEILGFIWAVNFDTNDTMRIKETLELTTFFISSHIARYKVIKRLHHLSYTDTLTGLPNRFASTDYISGLIQKKEQFAVVYMDLNHFKRINDTLGLETGNQVLIEVSKRWKTVAERESAKISHFLTRFNGDEFLIIISGYRSEEELRASIEPYSEVLSEHLCIDDCDFYITASLGYAEYPTDAWTAEALILHASAAMNEIKKAYSSDHILRFSADIIRNQRTLEIENKIRAALDNETIYFNLQPQFDMNHKLRGFEALARMKDQDGSVISPGEFIPITENVGLIDKVDSMVFKKATGFFSRLLRQTGLDLTLSLNASVRHLMKNGFSDEIRELLNTTGIPANQLEIEITESIMIESVDKALQCIDEIREMGVKIAIDDFGTGYSSLGYLNRFPANLLKVDKSFIDKINSSKSSRDYVEAIISIGHIMGFAVIAEGVEQDDQLKALRETGCDFVQGYIWGRPLPPEDAEKLMHPA